MRIPQIRISLGRTGLNVPHPAANKKIRKMKMQMKTLWKFLPAMLLAAMTLTACVKNESEDVVIEDKIGFNAAEASGSWTSATKSDIMDTDIDSVKISETVTLNRSVETKGKRVDAMSTYGSFGTFAYIYSSSSSWASSGASLSPDYMYNLKSTENGTSWRPSDRDYYWPAATYKLSFFAYAPYSTYTVDGKAVSDYMKISGSDAKGAPVIDYTVPENLAQQVDILTADSLDVPGSFHKTVPMNFKHALAGVYFNAKTSGIAGVVIKKVAITGVYNSGTYAIGASSWTLGSTTDDFTFGTSKSLNGSYTEINSSSDSLFFMVPQTLPTGAKITVTYVRGGTEHTASASLAGKTWAMGNIYAYDLIIGDADVTYTFTVTTKSNPDNESDKAVYTVVSTKTTIDGSTTVTEQVPFDVTGLPTGFTYSLNGDGTVTITGPARTAHDSLVICGSALAMRTLDSLHYGNNPVDLTTGLAYNGSTRGEMANCYVVNCAGYFCFPCDSMGNGSQGVINTINSNTLRNNGYFCDYEGDVVYKSGKKLQTASIDLTGHCSPVLLWEDQKGLVNDLVLDGRYIRFRTMAKSKMVPGNAVIAIENAAGVIMWSWHIWFTTAPNTYHVISPLTQKDSAITLTGVNMFNKDNGVSYATNSYYLTSYSSQGHLRYQVNSTAKTTKIMQVNLGAVERNRYYKFYDPRTASITFTQSVSGNTAVGVYDQGIKDVEITPAGYTNTLYQWGRKDPFISGNISTYASDNNSYYYTANHPNGVNTFTLSGNSTSNETDGIFGTYPVQDNSAIETDGSNESDYAVNLTFAIQHPMTLIYNTYSLEGDDTPVDWFTHYVDYTTQYNTEADGIVDLEKRYENAFLWGSGYYWHDYQTSSVKTIYDPSPAGYKVAVGYCYDALAASGSYNHGNNTTIGVFFPATGMRDAVTGELKEMGVRGDFWCSSLRFVERGNDNACYVKSANGEFGHAYAGDELYRGTALSVRPVGTDY